jgi:hypothetical protein
MEDSTMPKAAITEEPKGFAIPVDLLKSFRSDVRTIPHNLPHNGYIVFDRAMLTSILRGNDVEARTQLAAQIDKVGAAGGELVIIAR